MCHLFYFCSFSFNSAFEKKDETQSSLSGSFYLFFMYGVLFYRCRLAIRPFGWMAYFYSDGFFSGSERDARKSVAFERLFFNSECCCCFFWISIFFKTAKTCWAR